MRTFKPLRNLLLIITAVLLILSVTFNEATAGPRLRVCTATPHAGIVLVKPGPGYVWVKGRYKVSKCGKVVWIPAHWKRF